jgi:hypothetical protein
VTPTPQLLDLNNVDEIAEFIISYVNKHNSKAPTHAA